jgi:hypothetical protein
MMSFHWIIQRKVEDTEGVIKSRKWKKFGEYVNCIYANALEMNDDTDTDRSTSYLDLHLKMDSEVWLRTKLQAKDFTSKEMISVLLM